MHESKCSFQVLLFFHDTCKGDNSSVIICSSVALKILSQPYLSCPRLLSFFIFYIFFFLAFFSCNFRSPVFILFFLPLFLCFLLHFLKNSLFYSSFSVIFVWFLFVHVQACIVLFFFFLPSGHVHVEDLGRCFHGDVVDVHWRGLVRQRLANLRAKPSTKTVTQ